MLTGRVTVRPRWTTTPPTVDGLLDDAVWSNTDPLGFFVAGLNDGERREDGEIFNVNIFRALNTYQFTDRLALRNITEFNTYDGKVALNFLATYRVNLGTAFYIGYDDHYQQYDRFYDDQVNITDRGYLQTNRAVFTKIQYLFRY